MTCQRQDQNHRGRFDYHVVDRCFLVVFAGIGWLRHALTWHGIYSYGGRRLWARSKASLDHHRGGLRFANSSERLRRSLSAPINHTREIRQSIAAHGRWRGRCSLPALIQIRGDRVAAEYARARPAPHNLCLEGALRSQRGQGDALE